MKSYHRQAIAEARKQLIADIRKYRREVRKHKLMAKAERMDRKLSKNGFATHHIPVTYIGGSETVKVRVVKKKKGKK